MRWNAICASIGERSTVCRSTGSNGATWPPGSARSSRTIAPIAAARARGALSALFAWAVGEGYAGQNAVIGTHRPDEETTSRDRVLTDAELVAVWNASRDDDYGRIQIGPLILTGQRRDEIGAMAWSELDKKLGTWSIPETRTKNKRPHMITLPPMAWSIIKQVDQRDGIDCLLAAATTDLVGGRNARRRSMQGSVRRGNPARLSR